MVPIMLLRVRIMPLRVRIMPLRVRIMLFRVRIMLLRVRIMPVRVRIMPLRVRIIRPQQVRRPAVRAALCVCVLHVAELSGGAAQRSAGQRPSLVGRGLRALNGGTHGRHDGSNGTDNAMKGYG